MPKDMSMPPITSASDLLKLAFTCFRIPMSSPLRLSPSPLPPLIKEQEPTFIGTNNQWFPTSPRQKLYQFQKFKPS